MGFGRLLKKCVRGMVNWANSENPSREYADKAVGVAYPVSNKNIGGEARGMNFVVYNATGGKVIQFSYYNQHTDRHRTELYIITDKEDLGEELSQIITKESLVN